MEAQINTILHNINQALLSDTTEGSSLLMGKSGIVLFSILYDKHFDLKNSSFIEAAIQNIAEESLDDSFYNLCRGKAGINWFFTYLKNKNFVSQEDRDYICDDDEHLGEVALDMLKSDHYDFLHGALGIAYYLLYSGKPPVIFFDNFFQEVRGLIDKSIDKKMIPDFDLIKQTLIPDQVNLGLAHGIPSFLKFCLVCMQRDVSKESAERFAREIVSYLLANINLAKDKCFFGSNVKSDSNHVDGYSRLAWCYGDLSIGFILHQAGKVLQDDAVIKLALEMLAKSTERKSVAETGVVDDGICHGTAGVAHMYQRIWQDTRLPAYKEACDFWTKKLVDNLITINWLDGYKKYTTITGAHEQENGLLEGSAGIGLVLLSYLNGDNSWDYCLMLN